MTSRDYSPSRTGRPPATRDAVEAKRDVRCGCLGDPPLSARLEPWMVDLAAAPEHLSALLFEHDSPLNLHRLEPFARNAAEISEAAASHGLEIRTFFARKANKCLSFVEEADRLGLGVDVAGERELAQVLASGVPAERIMVTAAVKTEPLLELCLGSGVTVAIDNLDELDRLATLAASHRTAALPVALRLAPGRLTPGRTRSRFGLQADALFEAAARIGAPGAGPDADHGRLRLAGLHFHLDGYDSGERAVTIGEALELLDQLRRRGHRPTFLDIGGGFPISYLDDKAQWQHFWDEQGQAVLGRRPPLTFDGDGLGLRAGNGVVEGEPAAYPYWQQPVRGEWLQRLLAAETRIDGRTEQVAAALGDRAIELRCEPGRALLDGCGMTAARVEHTKPYEPGTSLAALAMNRTQCRTASGEPLLDPLLVPGPSHEPRTAAKGYLVGAYCIERELLSSRRLRFPDGIARGDVVLFPNTAGYFMHILESSSHQMPLARNLVLTGEAGGGLGAAKLDPIDGVSPRSKCPDQDSHLGPTP